MMTLYVLMLLLGSVSTRLASWPWPIRGRVPFSKLINFQCYLSAIFLPCCAFNLLATTVVVYYISTSRSDVALYALFLPVVIAYPVGKVLWLVYTIPGLSKLYGVSYLRIFAGLNLWNVAGWSVIGLVI